jgi:hypothetical protein
VAVENALERAHYAPKDAEHLGYFTIPWPRFAGDWLGPSEERTSALWNYQTEQDCTSLIATTMAEIKKLDTGIFVPIARQPVVGALLLPFGSAGISALLQYLH